MNHSLTTDKRGGASGLGTVSIFTILLVCSLTAFSILSLVSAQADLRLSLKNADFVKAYYSADSAAERLQESMVAAHTTFGMQSPERQRSALEQAGAGHITVESRQQDLYAGFTLPIGEDGQKLLVRLLIHADGSVDRLSWNMVSSEQAEQVQVLPVWTGEDQPAQ